MNMDYYKKENKKFAYGLVLIDVFTRFVWTYPLITLGGLEMEAALKTIFPAEKTERLQTDKGTEFNNKHVKKYLKDQNIIHFTTTNEVKASLAERSIRSIKTRLTRFMYKNDTPHWLDALPEVTEAYNNAKHRSIKMSPSQARTADQSKVWFNQYQVKNPKKKKHPPPHTQKIFKYKVDDRVRL